MIFLIDRRNRDAFASQLDEMFRIRHRIYVKERGWSALARTDEREIDQFDDDNAIYLLGLDESGHVISGLRLLETTGPTLMRNVFPHLVTQGEVPNDPRTLEMTRYFLTTVPRDKELRRKMSGEIICAMMEYGLARGATNISLVCDTFFLPMMMEFGPNIFPLGLPTAYDEGTCIAVMFPIYDGGLRNARNLRGVQGPVLMFSANPPPHAVPDATKIAA
jgi:acyl-homoserine lactone synthase